MPCGPPTESWHVVVAPERETVEHADWSKTTAAPINNAPQTGSKEGGLLTWRISRPRSSYPSMRRIQDKRANRNDAIAETFGLSGEKRPDGVNRRKFLRSVISAKPSDDVDPSAALRRGQ